MGCKPSRSSDAAGAGEGVDKVQQLIIRLDSRELDPVQLQNVLVELKVHLWPSIYDYQKRNHKALSKADPNLLFQIEKHLSKDNADVVSKVSDLIGVIDTMDNRSEILKDFLKLMNKLEDSRDEKLLEKAGKKLEKWWKVGGKVEEELKNMKVDLESLRKEQGSAREEVKQRKVKVEWRLKRAKKGKKVCDVVQHTVLAVVLLCVVVLAAMHCPPAAIGAVSASAAIVGWVKHPMNVFWKKRVRVVKAEKEVVDKMVGLVEVHELENIRLEMGKLDVEMMEVVGKLEVALGRLMEGGDENDDVFDVREEMKKKVEKLEVDIGKVRKQAEASVAVLQKLASKLLKSLVED